MHGPAIVTWLLAALAAGSAGFCVVRLRDPAHPRAHREADAAEAAMGVGMVGMVVLPGAAWGWLYAGLAAVLLLGALGADGGRAHRLHHGIGALAMTYMELAMTGSPAHQHHAAPAGLPTVTGALLLYFGAYSLWAGSRLLSAPGRGRPVLPVAGAALERPPSDRGGSHLPGLAAPACRVAMGIGMFAMLLTL